MSASRQTFPASHHPSATQSSSAWDRQHLLGLEGLSAADLIELLDLAESFRVVARGAKPPLDRLAGCTIANLFFEDSTRTRSSFTLAARRLGAQTLDLTTSGSSVMKGETIVDTALNVYAMGVDGFVVRAAAAGMPGMIAKLVNIPVINAGDGSHEHPTQGLLDIMTLRQRFGELAGRTVAIVGDINYSRVARSNIHGLTTLGANVVLVGPPTLAPKTFEKIAAADSPGRVRVHHDLDEVLAHVDAIMMLRVQFERQGPASTTPPSGEKSPVRHPSMIASDYRELYGLNAARAARLPAHAVVMHPGPMNRGLEIDSDVADDPKRSVILQAVTNSVAARMAVMSVVCQSTLKR